jgi:predicted PurR-regulated permease PerM
LSKKYKEFILGTNRRIRKLQKNSRQEAVIHLTLRDKISIFLKKNKKYLIYFLSILFIVIVSITILNVIHNNKIREVNENIKKENIKNLKAISPILFNIYYSQDTNVSQDNNDKLSKYYKIINSSDIDALTRYSNNDDNVFIDFVKFKLATLYFAKNDFVNAKYVINSISDDKLLSSLKTRFLEQVNLTSIIKEAK